MSELGLIAVLTAVAKPVFVLAPEKTQESVCDANKRSSYGEVMTAYLSICFTEKSITDKELYDFDEFPCPSQGVFEQMWSWEILMAALGKIVLRLCLRNGI